MVDTRFGNTKYASRCHLLPQKQTRNRVVGPAAVKHFEPQVSRAKPEWAIGPLQSELHIVFLSRIRQQAEKHVTNCRPERLQDVPPYGQGTRRKPCRPESHYRNIFLRIQSSERLRIVIAKPRWPNGGIR